eukprot:TRINITY_DN832_c0_g1_i1.p1 TRINITY_DN832_c0_g1~~TRINITY_DN832_c0_g1_i1.p1  ORF type:complete len:1725 (-),score=428.66 TRINITY_DN832_c0_g1_i1:31-4932(-)
MRDVIDIEEFEIQEPPHKKRKIVEEKNPAGGKTKAKLRRRSSGRGLDVQRAIMNFTNLDKSQCVTLGNFTVKAELSKDDNNKVKTPTDFEKTYLAHMRYNVERTAVEIELMKDKSKIKARAHFSENNLLKSSSEMNLNGDIIAAFVHLFDKEVITFQGRFVDPKQVNDQVAIKVDVLLLPYSREEKTDDSHVNYNWIKPLQQVMAWVTNDREMILSLDSDSKTFDPSPLYQAIRPLNNANNTNNNSNTNVMAEVVVEHRALKATLRNYQKRAVSWMVNRESKANGDAASIERLDEVSPMWKKITTPTDQSFYYNKFSGVIASDLTATLQEMSGGILADEMGLGKTVEVLTLVLMNPKNNDMQVDEGNNTNVKGDKKVGKKRKHEEVEDDQNPAEDSDEEIDDTYDQIRCYCGEFEETEDDYVLCDRCKSWQHCRCVGFDPVAEKGDNYVCPECCKTEKQLEVKGTIIVCPESIIDQWHQEITKHTLPDTVSVLKYTGVRNLNFNKAGNIVRAKHLKDYDVVLTTYSVLRDDLYHIDTDAWKNRASKYYKKYRALPTPLTGVKWHRIVLDEAQMVGEGANKAASMVAQLTATHRWAVSGTPIQKGLDDLHSLIVFLGMQPYASKPWWKQCIALPYENSVHEAQGRLHTFLKRIMWRNNKVDVADELGIPPQHEYIHKLSFTAVEEYFYRKRHGECAHKVHEILGKKLRRSTEGDEYISAEAMKALLRAILRLRQACCHPQVGSRTGFQPLQKNTLTMKELLRQLIAKANLDCTEAQRQKVAAMNGLAAINLLEDDFEAAIKHYRDVLSISSEINIDSLQLIHTYHNLAWAIAKTNGWKVKRADDSEFLENQNSLVKSLAMELDEEKSATNQDSNNTNQENNTNRMIVTEDEPEQLQSNQVVEPNSKAELKELERKENELKLKYIQRFNFKLVEQAHIYRGLVKEADTLGFKDLCNAEKSWWSRALDYLVSDKKLGEDFVEHLKGEMQRSQGYQNNKREWHKKFNNVHGLRFLMMNEFDKLVESRKEVLNNIERLLSTPVNHLQLMKFANCRHQGSHKSGSKCDHCKQDDLITAYESKVSFFRKEEDKTRILPDKQKADLDDASKDLIEQDVTKNLTYKEDSELEITLRILAGYLKTDLLPRVEDEDDEKLLVEGAQTSQKIFAALKKEPKALRDISSTQLFQLNAQDELDMCISRIRFKQPNEEVAENEKHYIISPHEVESMRLKFNTDKITAEAEFRQHLSQLKYLQKIESTKEDASKESSNNNNNRSSANESDECPICHDDLSVVKDVVVLTCGHELCCPCCLNMLERAMHGTIKCPSCRARMNSSELSYITRDNNNQQAQEPQIEVKGSWGTKLESVTRKIMSVLEQDKAAKILVFSQWIDVLTLLSRALTENNIAYLQLNNQRKKFQQCLDEFKSSPTCNVLLLPVKSGGNGLNLIEATHVMIVEPTMNPAIEAQVLGRVHRIGQTRETYVHRFVIQDTVEEKVYTISKTKSSFSSSGFGVKRKEENMLTVNELNDLIGGTRKTENNNVVIGENEDLNQDEYKLLMEIHEQNNTYWATKVLMNNRVMARRDALSIVQRVFFLECSSQGQVTENLPQIVHYGHKLATTVVEQLNELQVVNDDDEDSDEDNM